jgi:hypothetical protein
MEAVKPTPDDPLPVAHIEFGTQALTHRISYDFPVPGSHMIKICMDHLR